MMQPSAAHLSALLERTEGPRPLGCYLPAGFPDLAASAAVLERSVRDADAEFIELGIPHSHPYLDGMDITRAHVQALRVGTSMADVLAVVGHLAPIAPVMIMTYASPVLCYGTEAFAEALAEAGAAGAMIVDLPGDEEATWHRTANLYGLHAPRLMEPAARPTRMLRITHAATGWMYVPAATGVTGYQGELDIPALSKRCARVRLYCSPPIVTGSGVSTPDLAAAVAPHVQGVVIGSPIVRALLEDPGPSGADAAVHLVRRYTRALRAVPAASTSPPPHQGPGGGKTS